ncbi:hypothetical protein AcV7_006911 [Taiwanofungus camphoratus]|nr:hypothetical protein AcV7_006911 [Antrodia cinnamomea]
MLATLCAAKASVAPPLPGATASILVRRRSNTAGPKGGLLSVVNPSPSPVPPPPPALRSRTGDEQPTGTAYTFTE